MDTQRDQRLDIARGLAMILVIYGHALEIFISADHRFSNLLFAQWKLIYSFHMPLFFFISGHLFRAKPPRRALEQAITLIVIAFLAHTILWAVHYPLLENELKLGALVFPFKTFLGFQGGVLWFLASLALVELSHHWITTLPRARKILFATAIVTGFVWAQVADSNRFQQGSLLPGLIFYSAGRFAALFAKFKRPNKELLYLSMAWLATIVFSALNQGCPTSFTADCPDKEFGFAVVMAGGEYGNPWLFSAAACMGCSAALMTAGAILRHASRFSQWLAYIGRHTLDLLLLNAVFFQFILPFLRDHLVTDSLVSASGVIMAVTMTQLLMVKIMVPLTRQLKTIAAVIAQFISARR